MLGMRDEAIFYPRFFACPSESRPKKRAGKKSGVKNRQPVHTEEADN